MLTDAEEDTLNTSRQTLCLERNEESWEVKLLNQITQSVKCLEEILHAEGRTDRMDIKPAESAAELNTLFVYAEEGAQTTTRTAHRGSDSIRRISHTFTSLPQNDGNRNCGNRAETTTVNTWGQRDNIQYRSLQSIRRTESRRAAKYWADHNNHNEYRIWNWTHWTTKGTFLGLRMKEDRNK